MTTTPLAELLKQDTGRAFDAVIIATPAATHYELALSAIESGRHVLVEKPMAMDYRGAAHLVEAAAERGVKLQVGHLFEMNPGVEDIRARIRKGELGHLEYIFSHQLSPGRIRHKEDVILSLAPHDVSIMLTLAGSVPNEVTALGAEYAEADIAGMAVVHLSWSTLAHEIRGHAHVSWLHPEKIRRVVVVGSEGSAVLDDRAGGVDYYRREGGENPFPHAAYERFDYRGAEPLKIQLERFVRYVKLGDEPPTTGANALSVMAVLDAARRSLLSGSVPTLVDYGD